ncbi:hypothetical protein [uncultured Rhodoblastus sp.]|uniref:hypothetical protein n=1 Tax=uncultured Rhodoblastus sp. TaxID=543037 RepID=UPI0025FBC371|nr:hypothetical protein [uncultured Rhodoblastus sp.]
MSKNVIANSTPSRRLFLAAGSAATVFGAITAAASSDSDAALIALGRELEEAWDQENKINDSSSDEDVVAACGATSAVVERIEAIPARTLEGFKVKARAVSWCHCGDFEGFGTTTDERIAARIIRDLLAI